MIPVLFKIGPISVYSFGLMLGTAFLVGSYVLATEFKRKRFDPNLASNVTIVALFFGVVGAKLWNVAEVWFSGSPVTWSTVFSPSGLTWYGGFALGVSAVVYYVRRIDVPVLQFLDCLGVALILSYGVGRIGCHLSGDGDYGQPTRSAWGTIYSNGTAKPSQMVREYFELHPDEAATWSYDSLSAIHVRVDRLDYPVNRFDEVTPMHPTPLYEFLLGCAGFAFMWFFLRKRNLPDGVVFGIYLLMSSAFRFSVEFLRLNPRLLVGLSEAQLISVGLFVVGLVWTLRLNSKPSAA